MGRITTVGIMALAGLVMATASADAQNRRRDREREKAPPAPAAPAPDKRDRLVAAPGTPFNGRPYWQALAQCGGIYFKLNSLYSGVAIQAKVVKPDPAANAAFSKKSDAARRIATAFFEAAERFLIADRGLGREDAVMTYDARAAAEGDRHKTVEAAEQATKPCPALYQACRDHPRRRCVPSRRCRPRFSRAVREPRHRIQRAAWDQGKRCRGRTRLGSSMGRTPDDQPTKPSERRVVGPLTLEHQTVTAHPDRVRIDHPQEKGIAVAP